MSLYDRAAIIPGRSLTRSKSPDRLLKVWARAGDGPYVYDTESKRYIDMLCGLGAISLGYDDRDRESEWRGTGVYSLPHRLEIKAAEAVLQHVAPWASSVRFVKTGSEATHAAYRIAKKATGRHLVLIGDWAYHGWHEWTEQAGRIKSGHFPAEQIRQASFNPQLDEYEDIAAVFIEPKRWEPIDADWLQEIRDYCDQIGALLIFDEMIYGGRWALGGATEYYRVQPDLACYGKAFGNGRSVAFVVGNEPLVKYGEMISGTYSGDVDGLDAVYRTLKTYTTEPVIDTLWARGRQLQEGLRRVIPPELGIVEGAPVHQRIRFNEAAAAPVPASWDYRVADRPKAFAFRDAMAARGVIWHPDCTNIMYAHTPEIITEVLAAAKESAEVALRSS